jgi:TetR/AcrR family transcriptional regulator
MSDNLRIVKQQAEKRSSSAAGAEVTKERILQAAVAEFGARGYSGARTAAIAGRAGVNAQLISYHFGGKRGLLDELRQRWAAKQATLVPADASFAESFAAYLDATLDQPDWSRLVIWQALGDAGGEPGESAAEQRCRMAEGLVRIRARQREGEITDAIEAEFVVLLSYALAFAPIAMPHIVADIFGDDPGLADYKQRCASQLAALLRADKQEEKHQ